MKLNIVPARTGLDWFRSGLRTFWRQPLALAGLFFMYFTAASLLMVIPQLGFLLALAIVPAATLGLMAATREAAQGKFPMPTLLISAFRAGRERLRAMLILGVFYAVGCLLISLLALGLAPLPTVPANDVDLFLSPEFRQHMLITLVLYAPLSLLFWHAPALVHWHGVPPLKSLFFSLVACLRNLGALTLYMAAWGILFMAVGTAIVILGAALDQPALTATLMFPTAMLLAAMFFSSLWFTFRDSFVADGESVDASSGSDAPPAAS